MYMHQQLWGYQIKEKIYLGVRERMPLIDTTHNRTRVHNNQAAADLCLHNIDKFPNTISELIAACGESHTKHKYTVWTECRGLLMLKQVVCIVTTVLLGSNVMLPSATTINRSNVLWHIFSRHFSAA